MEQFGKECANSQLFWIFFQKDKITILKGFVGNNFILNRFSLKKNNNLDYSEWETIFKQIDVYFMFFFQQIVLSG